MLLHYWTVMSVPALAKIQNILDTKQNNIYLTCCSVAGWIFGYFGPFNSILFVYGVVEI